MDLIRPTRADYLEWLTREPSLMANPAKSELAEFLSTHDVILYPPARTPEEVSKPDEPKFSECPKENCLEFKSSYEKRVADHAKACATAQTAYRAQMTAFQNYQKQIASIEEKTTEAWKQFRAAMPTFLYKHCGNRFRFMDTKYTFKKAFTDKDTRPAELFNKAIETLAKVEYKGGSHEERSTFLQTLGFTGNETYFKDLCNHMQGKLCVSDDESDNKAYFSTLAHDYLGWTYEKSSVPAESCTSKSEFEALLKMCKPTKSDRIDMICKALKLTTKKDDSEWNTLLSDFKLALNRTIDQITSDGNILNVKPYNQAVIKFLADKNITVERSEKILNLYDLTRPAPVQATVRTTSPPAPAKKEEIKPSLFMKLFGGTSCARSTPPSQLREKLGSKKPQS